MLSNEWPRDADFIIDMPLDRREFTEIAMKISNHTEKSIYYRASVERRRDRKGRYASGKVYRYKNIYARKKES